MTILFTPLTFTFGGIIAAAAPLVVQATYTCPFTKRAVLTHTYTQGNANGGAVGAIAEIFIDVVPTAAVASNRVNSLTTAGLLTRTTQSYEAEFDLVGGDLVRILTINGSAVAINMAANFTIREYG